VKKPVAVPSRFAGEDEEERGPAVRPSLPPFSAETDQGRARQSDWEESTSEEDAPKPAPSAAAPPKKKGTLKAKLAAKAAAAAAGEGSGSGDELYDEDAVLDPRAKARADRERELRSDLDNAAALLGTSGPPRACQSLDEVGRG
jgi:translation initiation factor 3 subunit J